MQKAMLYCHQIASLAVPALSSHFRKHPFYKSGDIGKSLTLDFSSSALLLKGKLKQDQRLVGMNVRRKADRPANGGLLAVCGKGVAAEVRRGGEAAAQRPANGVLWSTAF